MNQSILFNDDHKFDDKIGKWVFSGMVAGENITIIVHSSMNKSDSITDEMKFDWENIVEEWLEDNEPDNQLITIYSK